MDAWDGVVWAGLGWAGWLSIKAKLRAWLVCLFMNETWVGGWLADLTSGRMGGLESINGVCNGRMDDLIGRIMLPALP